MSGGTSGGNVVGWRDDRDSWVICGVALGPSSPDDLNGAIHLLDGGGTDNDSEAVERRSGKMAGWRGGEVAKW